MGECDDVASRIRADEPRGHADTVLRGQRRGSNCCHPGSPHTLAGYAGQEFLSCGCSKRLENQFLLYWALEVERSTAKITPGKCCDILRPRVVARHRAFSEGELPRQFLRRRCVSQLHVIGQAILKWRIGFAYDERRQIATRGLGDAESVGTDEVGRQ
jgi:hypothetical protein